jgi:hypothetical protein
MKKLNLYLLLLLSVGFVTLNSCKKKKNIVQFLESSCLRAKEVRENGTIVYAVGGASNSKPAYAKFKMVLTNTPSKTIEIVENDGTVTKGTWEYAAGDKLVISGLNPPLTDAATGTNTRTTAEYTASAYNAKAKEVTLTALTKNLKVGDATIQYIMIPCE